MLIFDQLKKDDPQLRLLAVIVGAGFLILLGGLWWLQVVTADHYREKLQNQSLRTVRIPAVRGDIVDRDGNPLAQNISSYNVDLYLEDLTRSFQTRYSQSLKRLKLDLAAQAKAEAIKLGRKLTAQEAKQFAVTDKMTSGLVRDARFEVSSQTVSNLGVRLQQNIPFDRKVFQRRYDEARVLPLPVMIHLDPTNIARFEEQSMHTPGLNLDVQSLRFYPNGSIGAHFLGYVTRSGEVNDGDYTYRLEDYAGKAGLERRFEDDLQGVAGVKSVVVNNQGYRQTETVLSEAEPGSRVVLTIDLEIQKAAERALKETQANVRGAVIVMNATNGDVLALVSAPTFDPNFFVQRTNPAVEAAEWARLSDENQRPQINRATHVTYEPGSIFKIIVSLAGLEEGTLDPKEIFHSEGFYRMQGVRNGRIGDTAKEGNFDFDRAFAKSSNPYFITHGFKPGVLQRVLSIGRQLHLGEQTGLLPGQDAPGHLPSVADIKSSKWYPAETAFLSIGQGQVDVTPLQVAVMTAAVANGGKVYWPRLVSRVEPSEAGKPAQILFEEGRLRDTVTLSAHTLQIVHNAMLADVESPEGTGKAAAVPGFKIAGKTGTAEVESGGRVDKSKKATWFVSFAPFDKPRYAVVAMVEGGASGGISCAPIAHKVYEAILKREAQAEKKGAIKNGILAQTL